MVKMQHGDRREREGESKVMSRSSGRVNTHVEDDIFHCEEMAFALNYWAQERKLKGTSSGTWVIAHTGPNAIKFTPS